MRVESQWVGVRDLRVSAWGQRMAFLSLWLAGAAVYGGAFPMDEVGRFLLVPLGLLSGTSFLLGLRTGAFAGSTQSLYPGSVTVEGGVIEVVAGRRRRRIRVEDVMSGWREPHAHGGDETAVLVTRDGTEVRFSSPRIEHLDGLLRASGGAADQRAVRIRVAPGPSAAVRARAIFTAFVCLSFMSLCLYMTLHSLTRLTTGGDGAAGGFWMFGIFTGIFLAGALRYGRALLSTTLSIGTDGVIVESLFRKRLLRHAEIVACDAASDVLVLYLATGKSIRISAGAPAAVAARNRINEALRARALSGAPFARLERDGRTVATWITDLRGLVAGSRGYREAALSREDLIDVVKDGGAPAERRVGAAVALSSQRDEDVRIALRIAADTCVDEKLRVVLGSAGEMDEEAFAEAVAEATERSSPGGRA